MTSSSAPKPPRWLAASPGKRWAEVFFLWYSVAWIAFFFGGIVVPKSYEWFEEWSYFIVGLIIALPPLVVPLFMAKDGHGDPGRPVWQRYWVKANVWIAILSFIGNYLWTHYFYNLLGASYTFKAWRLNDVPIALILITHGYFITYHTLTTIGLRRFWTSHWYARQKGSRVVQVLASCAVVFAMSYFTAFMETLTISSFPYYVLKDRSRMYSIGSICYALYFIVTFPMYYRIDEDPADGPYDMERVVLSALGSCMAVTLLLDFWRISLGGIVPGAPVPSCVPFL